MSIAALAGVHPSDAGLASGLINKQISGALGIAVPSSIATLTTTDAIAYGDAVANALTEGFQAAFIGAAATALVGILVSLVVVRREDPVESQVAATHALEAV